jgi:serine/tyrosine/threonine adenylyltransferase
MIVNDKQALSNDRPNPFLTLTYEPALEALDCDYFDPVAAAQFPQHILRFRNDDLLPLLGIDPQQVTDQDFIAAFGQFQERSSLLALRYHGYQFGEYNPALGDGRGFLYGQVRGTDGELYDFGTKGSGTTPYSRGGDGRLTLKGGVREVIAAEALYRMGVRTSRCLSLIETGEALWRGDEPSPTRSSVMVRFSRSHIRFGTFERLHFLGRKDLIQRLLEHVIEQYYPHLLKERDRYALFYQELVQRVADLVAQWMAAGFCHAVLNTDNMSITGESFDYGPYAFINTFDPRFTAAYFDYFGRYSYGNQPSICYWNLEMLQKPLSAVISMAEMEAGLATFADRYHQTYRQLMLRKLGFTRDFTEAEALVMQTLQLLQLTQVGYHDFFADLAQNFSEQWRDDGMQILSSATFAQTDEQIAGWNQWRQLYYYCLLETPLSEFGKMAEQLRRYNPTCVPIRPRIEAVWEPIAQADNWQPFNELLDQIRWKPA